MSAELVKAALKKVAAGEPFNAQEAEQILGAMTDGDASPAQMAAFVMGLRVRGETVGEITGAARLLRARMRTVTVPENAIDIVGTGGDGHHTYNISTASALVAAGAGACVAKHGNRSVSSLSGASDVLTALGVKLDCGLDRVEAAVREAGVGFLWAPNHHPPMKVWGPIRAELGVRSLFNLLGPICNPGGVKRQVVGVFSADWVQPIAEALKDLGSERVWVVHGHDGLDELSTTGATMVADVQNGAITQFDVTPEDCGLARASLSDLKGGDAKENAEAITALLSGAPGAYRDIVLLNAGAALVVGGLAATLADGIAQAALSIDSGKARAALDRLIAISNAN